MAMVASPGRALGGQTKALLPHKRRRIVMVLERKDIVALQYEEGCDDFLNNGELFLLDPQTDQTAPAVRILFSRELVVPGATLVQSPFDPDAYEEVSKAADQFAIVKFHCFSQFCALLGARKVRVEEIQEQAKAEHNRRRGGAKNGGTGSRARTGSDKKDLDRFRRQYSLKDEFEGGRPNLDEARGFLRTTGLSNDQVMLWLLNTVRSENKITSRELEFDMSIETQKYFDIMAKINVPKFLGLQADIYKKSRVRRQLRWTVSVEF